MQQSRPNIILLMCDDLGYGDTGFNGNTVIRTPHLDTLRAEGARFSRFYAGGPVCSPTRGTCLTGRHYSRYGVTHANAGRLPVQEITLPGVCRERGYRTGHFGKWHLGTLTTEVADSNRGGPGHPQEYSPPWLHDFDVCFTSEAKVPTWNPMITPDEKGDNGYIWGEPGTPFGTRYWNEKGKMVNDNLDGDDSRIIVDRVVPFIQNSVRNNTPFFAVVWFHAPHAPVVAGPEYRKLYQDRSEEEQHYYGCITAMDEQVGRLNQLAKELGIEDDTMIWFCSDNGPEGGEDLSRNGRSVGSTAGLRGRKRSLFNGGIEVPALVKWPGRVAPGSDIETPCSTLDYFPTITRKLGYRMPDSRPIDGCNLLPIFAGETTHRPAPIPFRFIDTKPAMYGAPTFAMIDNRHKYLGHPEGDRADDLVFDLVDDPCETVNLVAEKREFAAQMRQHLAKTVESFRKSHAGEDYNDPDYQPVNEFQNIYQTWW